MEYDHDDHVFFKILRDDCKENPDEDGLRSVAVKQQRIVDFTQKNREVKHCRVIPAQLVKQDIQPARRKHAETNK